MIDSRKEFSRRSVDGEYRRIIWRQNRPFGVAYIMQRLPDKIDRPQCLRLWIPRCDIRNDARHCCASFHTKQWLVAQARSLLDVGVDEVMRKNDERRRTGDHRQHYVSEREPPHQNDMENSQNKHDLYNDGY